MSERAGAPERTSLECARADGRRSVVGARTARWIDQAQGELTSEGARKTRREVLQQHCPMSSAEEVLAALHDADDSTEEAADQEEQGALLTVVVHLVGEEGTESAPLSVEVGGGAANALRCVLLCPLQVLVFLLRAVLAVI